jgi:hypothetical protein
LHLRERIHLGIALHAAVNLGFALAVTMSTVPVAEASASSAPAADPSPALERAALVYAAERTIVTLPSTAPAQSVALRRLRSATTVADHGLDRFDRLAMCESGGDPTAVSPSGRYRGAFQFSLATWQSAGGTGDPVDVSYAEQKRIAIAWVDVVDPSTQWPVCWPRTS